MKRILFFSVFALALQFAFSQNFQSSLEPSANQSVVYVASCDWGACIEKIVLHSAQIIPPNKIKAEDFKVSQILYPKSTNIGMTKGSLCVTDAFASDSLGNRISSSSDYITLLTDVHPSAENSSPFVDITLSDRFYPYYGYKITNSELKISITKTKGFVNSDIAKFSRSKYEYKIPATEEEKANPKYQEETVTLNYASFIPDGASDTKKVPLILWFHGMGENGTNPYKVLFGTKASALAGEKIQSYFENGAAILAPQVSSSWLVTTEKNSVGIRYWAPVDKDSVVKKVTKPLSGLFDKFLVYDDEPKQEKTPFAATSLYTEAVKKLLFSFLAEHQEIDRTRIYAGGCSAGGYMVMNMILESPEIFAAAFPVCEFYLDSKITSSQIKKLTEMPLWFVYAENDESVNPQNNSVPTIKRLKEAGAENLHSSVFRNVVDLSGKYLLNRNADKDDEEYGLPYEYPGHYSWIYVMNDACREDNLTLFEWLSRQQR
ncbi:MAG: prolyl oligopeptidase family serine peptidase [Treponema sp.]|nr:prolyl oligopeptidase family serine peptidase [Treponema sp.]